MNRRTIADEAERLEAELARIEAEIDRVRRRWPRLFKVAVGAAVAIEIARALGRKLRRA